MNSHRRTRILTTRYEGGRDHSRCGPGYAHVSHAQRRGREGRFSEEQEAASLGKQFTDLEGTPILIHTLRRFAAVDAVSEIWIALRENEIEGFRERLGKEAKDVLKKKIALVAGGEHRQQSVEHALNAVSAAADDVVLVHDAVRPLVTAEIIHDVIEAARKYGAAIAGLPAVDTVKQVERTSEGAIVKATIPRAGVVLAQTPQGFHYSVIKKAFDEAAADGFMGTDEASLAERSGHAVAVVMELAEKHQDHDAGRHGTGGVFT